jgi:predicted ATPase
MLTRLSLQNFKAWPKLDIEFGRITGLFGANSSGKSSLLQFLLMLKQTKNATDRGLVLDFGGPDQLVNLGTYRDVVRMHDDSKSISWSLDWDLAEPIRVTNTYDKRTSVLFEDSKLSTSAKVRLRNGSLIAEELAYRFSAIDFEIRVRSEGSTKYGLHPDQRDRAPFQFTRSPGRVWDLPGPIKTHLFPDQAKTYYQNADFLSDFEISYEKQMDQIYYLGPLREHPKREYQWAGARPEGVGLRGERVVDAILAATLRNETRNLGHKTKRRSFQGMVAYWLQTIGLISEFRIQELREGSNIYQAFVKRDANSPEALLTDVGFGVSQVLPAIVLMYYVPEGSTVILEQPEIHLHPAVQSGLADVILTAASTRKLQVIVESHSEHLVRRFQRRVAEESFSKDDTRLYFVQQRGGAAKIERLKMNLFGEIENWPENFFGDEFGELAAIRSAGLKRKLSKRAS